jgi:large subunit ribosomal protein L9
MQVILLERVEKLGQMGAVVKVKDGFARNFLLPRKKALRATKENIAQFEEQKAQLEARNLTLKKEAEGVAAKLDKQTFVVLRQAGESGMLYGSVSTRDISDAVSAGGVTLDRSQVVLDKAIKTLGLHPVKVVLHPEVRVAITLNVARTADEAERQAKGENIALTAAQEARLEADALFESAEAAAKAALNDDVLVETEAKPKPEPKKKKAAAEKAPDTGDDEEPAKPAKKAKKEK